MASGRRWNNIKYLHKSNVFRCYCFCDTFNKQKWSIRTVFVRKLNPTILAPHAVYMMRVSSSYSMRSLSCQCWMVLWQAARIARLGAFLFATEKRWTSHGAGSCTLTDDGTNQLHTTVSTRPACSAARSWPRVAAFLGSNHAMDCARSGRVTDIRTIIGAEPSKASFV